MSQSGGCCPRPRRSPTRRWTCQPKLVRAVLPAYSALGWATCRSQNDYFSGWMRRQTTGSVPENTNGNWAGRGVRSRLSSESLLRWPHRPPVGETLGASLSRRPVISARRSVLNRRALPGSEGRLLIAATLPILLLANSDSRLQQPTDEMFDRYDPRDDGSSDSDDSRERSWGSRGGSDSAGGRDEDRGVFAWTCPAGSSARSCASGGGATN